MPGENDEMAEFLNPVVSHPCRRLAHLLCYTLAKRAEVWTLLIRDKRISLEEATTPWFFFVPC